MSSCAQCEYANYNTTQLNINNLYYFRNNLEETKPRICANENKTDGQVDQCQCQCFNKKENDDKRQTW